MQFIPVTVIQDSPDAMTLLPTHLIESVMTLPQKMGGGSSIKCRYRKNAYRVKEDVQEISLLLQKRRID